MKRPQQVAAGSKSSAEDLEPSAKRRAPKRPKLTPQLAPELRIEGVTTLHSMILQRSREVGRQEAESARRFRMSKGPVRSEWKPRRRTVVSKDTTPSSIVSQESDSLPETSARASPMESESMGPEEPESRNASPAVPRCDVSMSVADDDAENGADSRLAKKRASLPRSVAEKHVNAAPTVSSSSGVDGMEIGDTTSSTASVAAPSDVVAPVVPDRLMSLFSAHLSGAEILRTVTDGQLAVLRLRVCNHPAPPAARLATEPSSSAVVATASSEPTAAGPSGTGVPVRRRKKSPRKQKETFVTRMKRLKGYFRKPKDPVNIQMKKVPFE